MRLLQLNEKGAFSLVEYVGNDLPRYAILSHTWGPNAEEVTYQDIQGGVGEKKNGYRKLTFCGKRASLDGLQYFWIDTCCIDKSSSAELSEAINSMFRWYKTAEKCYVYLEDVARGITNTEADTEQSHRWKPAFRKSRWFTRGWTLQELISPTSVEFFSAEGTFLGNKRSLEQSLHEITGIAIESLRGGDLNQRSVAERMAWAKDRETTRAEDAVYCLLGIFDVQMPLLYGEGQEKALKRLEKEIRESSGDAALSSQKDKRELLLESLRFDQIDARQLSIRNAHTKTCRWILRKSEYLDWLNKIKLKNHRGFFWIKGKPGTGKSTLMKFIVANIRKTMKGTTVIAFFFNARGEDMEKSTVGAYQSLLLQLLEQIPSLHCILETAGLSTSNIGKEHQWDVESLKMLLEQAIQHLEGLPVVCFIDALDECDEQQIRDMVSFFERVAELAVGSGILFRVCFSSRHYPYITIQRGIELILEGQEGHTQDITSYLASELKLGHSKGTQQIRNDLQEKASGVFMWVVLVINILNQEYDRGRMHALKQRLREIPSDLHELFRDILTRDGRNTDELLLCIQWVLFSKESLSPEQLYFAVRSGVEPDEAVVAWDRTEITGDVIKRFILDASKGLAEITASKVPKVHFIHESVRDFLLKENGLRSFWNTSENNLPGQSHERLKQCCLSYLDVDLYAHLLGFKGLPKASSKEAASLRKEISETFPFLEYAIRYVLYHADEAERYHVTQSTFLDSFTVPKWTMLNNIFEKREVRRHSLRATLMYILAEINMAHLIKIHPSIGLCLSVENERYGCPLFAAIATGSEEAVQECLRSLGASQTKVSSTYEPNDQDHDRSSDQNASRRDFKFSKRKGLLLCAAELGHPGVFVHLLSSGKFEADCRDAMGRTSLYLASRNGCETVVKVLINKSGVNINSKDNSGITPLHIATAKGHHAVIVALLLQKGADVHASSGLHENALQVASVRGHIAIVTLLLNN
ncbi:hypothetical protein GQ44DRAFT_676730, partial [Phaeosphaeriaceae sp. PMI808]